MNATLKKFIDAGKKDKDIAGALLFGSRAKGMHRKNSDVDICIILNRNFRGNMTKKRLKYMKEGMDVHIFQQMPLYMKARVIKEGKVLFISDKSYVYDIVLETLKEFEYFRPNYKMIVEGILHG